MQRTIYIVVIFLFFCLATGCGHPDDSRQPLPTDTLYTEEKAMAVYDHEPERALNIIDSAVAVGNLDSNRASLLRAKVFSLSTVDEHLDTACRILESLRAGDFVKDNPRNLEMVLDMLILVSRQLEDNMQYLRWSTEKIDLCRQQHLETEALRTEAEIGVVLAKMGEEEKGLAKLNGVIATLDGQRRFDEMDACVIVFKRKIDVLGMLGQPDAIIPTSHLIIRKVDDYRQHPDVYADDSYRRPSTDQEVADYCDFYTAQAYGYLARAYAEMVQQDNRTSGQVDNPKVRHALVDSSRYYLSLYQRSDYGSSFKGQEWIAPTLGYLGEYSRMIAIFDKVERCLGDDTMNNKYAIILQWRARAADAWGNHQLASRYWRRYSELSKQLNRQLLASRAYEYAVRYHLQEEQMKNEQLKVKSEKMAICAVAGVLLALVAVGFVVWFYHQRRATEHKNKVLVEQISEALKYKRLAEDEADAARSEQSPDPKRMNDEELYDFLSEAIRVEKLYSDPDFGRPTLAEHFHVSDRRIGSAFSSQRRTLPDFIRELRLEQSCKLLTERPGLSISDIAAAVGFSSLPVFSREFKKRYDVSPSYYRSSVNQ